MKYLIYITFCTILLITCNTELPIEELKREELFSINIGKLENQFDLFLADNEPLIKKNRLYVRDGLVYIANGNSAKIMEFTSYGDLIFLLYNPDINPEPFSLYLNNSETTNDHQAITNRIAVAHPLHDVGEIVVDSNRNLFIEDSVPDKDMIYDAEKGITLNSIIKVFDRYGNFIKTIGREGTGGTPFSYIESMHITNEDELVVVTKIKDLWIIYWFLKSGLLLYEIEIDNNHLPIPAYSNYMSSLEKIVPHYIRTSLYLMITNYKMEIDESTKSISTIKLMESTIHEFNFRTEKYEPDYIVIPQDKKQKLMIGTKEIEINPPPYEFLGINETGYFFFLQMNETNSYQLLILDQQGQVVGKRLFFIEDTDLFYKLIGLTRSGAITGLLCENYTTKVIWWRSDKLLEKK